jgi:hypothetical protein
VDNGRILDTRISNIVMIPSSICRKILIPTVEGSKLVYSHIERGTMGILTRQPVYGWVALDR